MEQSVVWLCLVILLTQSCIPEDLLSQCSVSWGIPEETSTSRNRGREGSAAPGGLPALYSSCNAR
jgi:hypothetical protein